VCNIHDGLRHPSCMEIYCMFV